jgi:hypothetical protein
VLRSLLILAFIGGIGTVAILVGTRPTIADGRVMGATLLDQNRARGFTKFDCDREIPIGVKGAVFECDVAATDGSTGRLEITMNRDGAFSSRLIGATSGPSPEARPRRDHVPNVFGEDPWGGAP